jgi:hypothetical protein
MSNMSKGTQMAKQEWFCERCRTRVTLYIKPSQPPIHRCAKKSNQILPLTLVAPTKGETHEQ